MQIDVRPDHLEIIKNALKLHVPDRRVVAFGSRVKWTARDTSDLDLCVMGDDKISFETLAALRNELSDSNLPYKVDVIDWASISPDFRKIVSAQCYEIKSPEDKGWSYKRLSDAALINPSVKLIKDNVYPFVDMAAIEVGRKFVEPSEQRPYSGGGSKFAHGDTLLARITPCLENGKIAMFHGSTEHEIAHGSTEFIVFRGRPEVSDNQFIYYLVTSQEVRSFAIAQMTGSSGRQRVPTSAFEHITVGLPSLPEQKAIANLLQKLDDKIELNNKMNETLEATAQALFKSWFVDFEPVKAKMEGRKPEGLTADLAALFPDKFVDSPLGQIPQGWDVKKLEDISEILNGFAFKSQDYRESGVYILRTKNFSDNGYAERLPDDVYLDDKLLPEYTKYLCEAFDYHVVMVGNSLGKTAYILPHLLPALRNQNMWCFRPKTKKQSRFYLNLYLDKKIKSVIGWASGSARSFFRKSDFQSYDILWPSEKIQLAFEEAVLPAYSKLSSNFEQNRRLANLRDTLLPKLILGELRIGDIQPIMEETT
jgi:type I restriction enzyme, S subunit